MSKRTSGPWTAVANEWDEVLAEKDRGNDWYIITEKEEVIAKGLGKTDARLIAAAPDLLAVCKRMIAHAGHRHEFGLCRGYGVRKDTRRNARRHRQGRGRVRAMSDIVERLHTIRAHLRTGALGQREVWEAWLTEAGAEIERLRAALQQIAAYPHSEEGGEIARRALEPKP